MTFKNQMALDAAGTILNISEFSEEVKYTPHGGAQKTINAIVERRRIMPAGEDSGRTLIGQMEISIANHETYGVATINKGQDIVSLPEVIGGADVTFFVADILEQDEGMWHLLLRK